MELPRRWINVIFLICAGYTIGSVIVSLFREEGPNWNMIIMSVIITLCYCLIIFQNNRLRVIKSQERNLPDEKLKLEVNQLSWPPVNSIVSIIVSIATVLILYFQGAFDIKENTLRYETAKLEWEKILLTEANDSVRRYTDSLNSLNDSLQGSVIKLENHLVTLEDALNSIRNQKNFAERRIIELEELRIRKEDTIKLLTNQMFIQRAYFEGERLKQDAPLRPLVEKINAQEERINSLIRELVYCRDSISKKIYRN